MRAIDAEDLKRSIAVSALIGDQKTLEQIIDEQPTIEERNTGKWINEGIYGEGHSERAIRCSNCDWHYIGYLDDYNFCPNCGARMER